MSQWRIPRLRRSSTPFSSKWKYGGAIIGGAVIIGSLTIYGLYEGYDIVVTPTTRLLSSISGLITGLQVDIGQVKGSLKSRKFLFNDIRMIRGNHIYTNVDVRLRELEIAYKDTLFSTIKKLISGEQVVLQQLRISGMIGQFELIKDDPKKPNFFVHDFVLFDSEVRLVDSRQLTGSSIFLDKKGVVRIPSIRLEKIISNNISNRRPTDLLFHSKLIKGTFGDGFFEISTDMGQRSTKRITWKGQNLSLGTIHKYLTPPLSWIDQVYLDFDVKLHNDLQSDSPIYDLHLDVLFRDVKTIDSLDASEIDRLPLHQRVAGLALYTYLNANPNEEVEGRSGVKRGDQLDKKTSGRSLPISFDLTLREDEFQLHVLSTKITDELIRQVIEESTKRAHDWAKKKWESFKQKTTKKTTSIDDLD